MNIRGYRPVSSFTLYKSDVTLSLHFFLFGVGVRGYTRLERQTCGREGPKWWCRVVVVVKDRRENETIKTNPFGVGVNLLRYG